MRVIRSPARGGRERVLDRGARQGRQLVGPSEHPDLDALLDERGRLVADRRLEQADEHLDLAARAGPVLAAERVDREHRDAPPDGVLDDRSDGLDAGRVALRLGQAALPRPAAVAVHDDRDVTGDGVLAVASGAGSVAPTGSGTGRAFSLAARGGAVT